MFKNSIHAAALCVALLIPVAITACGQKGSLYLPDEAPAAQTR